MNGGLQHLWLGAGPPFYAKSVAGSGLVSLPLETATMNETERRTSTLRLVSFIRGTKPICGTSEE
jgi:hypothetical protein